MRVILKHGSRIECVPNVSLYEGYRPVVDGVSPKSASNGDLNIESALWYKVFLLESVYIDCDERDVHWLRKESTVVQTIDDECENSGRFFPLGAQSLYSDVDVYDFDPNIDELADSANECMTLYAENKITWDTFRSEVARLLHCFIFPAVVFNKDDSPALEGVLLKIESKAQMVEKEIWKRSQSVERTETSLHNLRLRIVKNEKFDSEMYVRSCKGEFLTLLSKDIEKDIDKLNSELEGIQLQVNKYRDCDDSEEIKLKLAELRNKRNKLHEQIVFMQTVRETLRNVLFRPPTISKKRLKKIKVKENVFHEIYIEITDRLRTQKEDLQKSCLIKVKISSVREAIFAGLTELLDRDEESCSVRFTDGSEFSLDISGVSKRPDDWKTLEEKVYSLLQDNRSEAFRKHHHACKLIKDKIGSAVGDTRMFGESTESAEGLWDFVETMGQASRSQREGKTRSTFFDSQIPDEFDPNSVDDLKKSLDGIKDDIKKHMESMCILLMKTIPDCERRHKNKLWISYENVFYLEILPNLCQLYEFTYSPKSVHLFKTVSKVDLIELVDENFVMVLLNGIDSNIKFPLRPRSWRGYSASSEEFEVLSPDRVSVSRSLISLDIRKCTLDQLYTMANRDCNELGGSIPNVMDTIACSPVTSDMSDVTGDDDENESDISEQDTDTNDDCFTEGEIPDPCETLQDLFGDVMECLQGAFKAKTILEKLRRTTKVFRCLGSILSDMKENGQMASCDDMLSMIIVLLRCLDEETFVLLYANIVLMIDFRAPFLSGSVHDCSLTNFFGAYDFLYTSQLCKQSEVDHLDGSTLQ